MNHINVQQFQFTSGKKANQVNILSRVIEEHLQPWYRWVVTGSINYGEFGIKTLGIYKMEPTLEHTEYYKTTGNTLIYEFSTYENVEIISTTLLTESVSFIPDSKCLVMPYRATISNKEGTVDYGTYLDIGDERYLDIEPNGQVLILNYKEIVS